MAEILDQSEIFFTAFEPKLTNRFIMYIEGIPTYLVKAASKPSLQSGEVVLDHINIERKVKGKSRWQNITITLYNPVVPSGDQAAMEWIRLSHESVTGRNGYSDFYKKDITLNSLGPIGDKVEEWTLKGAFVVNMTNADLDWANDEAQTIQLELAYDYAILQW